MRTVGLVVIGGGSAGMAAALQARKEGIQDILILEKEDSLGGILTQCIHNGFGLTEFKEELTGPEYLQRFVEQVVEEKIPYECGAQVLDLSKDKVITYSKDGKFETLQAKAMITSVIWTSKLLVLKKVLLHYKWISKSKVSLVKS